MRKTAKAVQTQDEALTAEETDSMEPADTDDGVTEDRDSAMDPVNSFDNAILIDSKYWKLEYLYLWPSVLEIQTKPLNKPFKLDIMKISQSRNNKIRYCATMVAELVTAPSLNFHAFRLLDKAFAMQETIT